MSEHQNALSLPADGKYHGSPAAWTTVIIVIAGFCVGAIAMVVGASLWVYLGLGGGIAVLGAVVGKVLYAMGLGNKHELPGLW